MRGNWPNRAVSLTSPVLCSSPLLQWDCLATSITLPQCVTGKISFSISMAFLLSIHPLVDPIITTITTKASVKTSSPA